MGVNFKSRYLDRARNPNWLQMAHGLVAVAEGLVMVLSLGFVWPPWLDAVLMYKIFRKDPKRAR